MINTNKPKEELESKINDFIGYLFRGINVRSVEDCLRQFSAYYEFLANQIDLHEGTFSCRLETLKFFESSFLWISEKLRAFPETILKQYHEIFQENLLCSFFAEIQGTAYIKDSTLHFVFRPKYSSALFSILQAFTPFRKSEETTETSIFYFKRVKLALIRVSQILNYASSLDRKDMDVEFDDFKEGYDPDQIDRNKLVAVVSFIRSSLKKVPDCPERLLIEKKLDVLETEIRSPKPRWGIIITGFFVLFGFVADLKTVSPQTFAEVYGATEKAVFVLHEDAQVKKQQKLFPKALISQASNTQNLD